MLLNKITLFEDLPEPDMELITKLAVTRTFPKKNGFM